MTELHTACPSWLDDDAKIEWEHRVASDRIDDGDREILEIYCVLRSLSHRVGDITTKLRAAAEDSSPEDRQALLTVIVDLEARILAALQTFAAALGIPFEGTGRGRPTRITVLDEEGPVIGR